MEHYISLRLRNEEIIEIKQVNSIKIKTSEDGHLLEQKENLSIFIYPDYYYVFVAQGGSVSIKGSEILYMEVVEVGEDPFNGESPFDEEFGEEPFDEEFMEF